MPEKNLKKKKLSPKFAAQAEQMAAAYDVFLKELGILRKKRKALTERVMKRVEGGKIDEVRKRFEGL